MPRTEAEARRVFAYGQALYDLQEIVEEAFNAGVDAANEYHLSDASIGIIDAKRRYFTSKNRPAGRINGILGELVGDA